MKITLLLTASSIGPNSTRPPEFTWRTPNEKKPARREGGIPKYLKGTIKPSTEAFS
jgi:hypothetical protein